MTSFYDINRTVESQRTFRKTVSLRTFSEWQCAILEKIKTQLSKKSKRIFPEQKSANIRIFSTDKNKVKGAS